jgi:hypothetical protein
MNFSLNEDQTSLLTGLDQLLASEAPPAPTEPVSPNTPMASMRC